jgi:hypothetical protein
MASGGRSTPVNPAGAPPFGLVGIEPLGAGAEQEGLAMPPRMPGKARQAARNSLLETGRATTFGSLSMELVATVPAYCKIDPLSVLRYDVGGRRILRNAVPRAD